MIISLRRIGLLALAICAFPANSLHAQASTSVTLAWDPNPESDLKEYRLHVGSSSRDYDIIIPVGLVTSFKVVDLPAGSHYYFALTAVNDSGSESEQSDEVVFVPPPAGGRLSLLQATSDFQITLNGTPQSEYSIEASSNLRDWATIDTKISDASGVVSITMDRSQQGHAQFFRAVKLP